MADRSDHPGHFANVEVRPDLLLLQDRQAAHWSITLASGQNVMPITVVLFFVEFVTNSPVKLVSTQSVSAQGSVEVFQHVQRIRFGISAATEVWGIAKPVVGRSVWWLRRRG
jgi:hypothetical protein